MNKQEYYMQKAIALAKKGAGKTYPNPLVGAVIVKNNKIIAADFHREFGKAHAEINALKRAGKKSEGASLFVSLEPCAHFGKTPPCVDAIIKSKIKKVIIAMKDPNPLNSGKGINKLRAAGIEAKIGICASEAKDLNAAFLKYIKNKMPYVTLKIAQSLDGKISTETGDSRWISSEQSRGVVHALRRNVGAIMVGAGTIIKDDPLLTARPKKEKNKKEKGKSDKQPVKIIVDSKLRVPLNSRVFSDESPAKTIIATTALAPKARINEFFKKNTEILPVKSKNSKVDLTALMKILARRGITSILIEGGAMLAASAIEEKIVDKVLFFVSPKIIGNSGKIKNAPAVKHLKVKKIGCDYLFTGVFN